MREDYRSPLIKSIYCLLEELQTMSPDNPGFRGLVISIRELFMKVKRINEVVEVYGLPSFEEICPGVDLSSLDEMIKGYEAVLPSNEVRYGL